MKKTLFGTTSLAGLGLVAASPAVAQIELGLGGYMNNYFAVGENDPDDGTDYAPTGLFSDGEVWFTGEFTADNGLTFGANVQLESFGGTADQIDENFGYINGGFGRFQFGSENTAAYLMHFAAPSVGVPVNTGWVTSFIAQPAGHTAGFRTPGLSTYVDPGNDENVLTYFTPRFFGFQLGGSYQPAVVFTGEGLNAPVFANENTQYNNGVSIGLNFVETLGSVDLAISGGYRRAEAPDNAIGGVNPDDLEQVSFGATVGFAGLTIGGSYANETEGRIRGAGISSEGYSYDVGASYSNGPWTFGLLYFHGREEGSLAVGGDNTLDTASAAVEYVLAPGVEASLTGMYADWRTEGPGRDNDGFSGILGIEFGF